MKSKPITDPHCIHMPVKENTVIIFSCKQGKNYDAGFCIGVQYFAIASQVTKKESKWYCDVLETAFQNLIKPYTFGIKVNALEMLEKSGMLNPKITVENYGK